MFPSASEPLFSQKLPPVGSPVRNGSNNDSFKASNDSFQTSGHVGYLKFDTTTMSTKHARVNALTSKISEVNLRKPNAVIHTGVKNFWRINTNVEFHFIEHLSYDIIEVIAYKAETEEESPRLHLSLSKVLAKCSQEDILTRLNTKREDHIRKKIPIKDEELETYAKHAAIAQHILARLTVDPDCLQPGEPFRIKFTSIIGDSIDEAEIDIEVDRPETMSDTVIPRKKRTTLGEFNHAMKDLVSDTKLLSSANEKAQHLAEVARISVDAFIGAASSSIGNIAMYTVPRQRWIRAINRVMYDNYVAKYITPLLAQNVVAKVQKHVTFQLPKIDEKVSPNKGPSQQPKAKKAGTTFGVRKTVLS